MTKPIRSIGWLNAADGSVNLTPVYKGAAFPVMVNVTRSEYNATDGSKEALIALAQTKLQSSDTGR